MDILSVGPFGERVLVALAPLLFALCERLPCGRADRLYALALFTLRHRRLPRRVKRFNDMLFLLKWDGRLADPLVVRTTDKELVKGYVEETLGPGHTVPTLAVLRTPAEIDAHAFPERGYIKATSASGDVMILDGTEPDRERLKSWLTRGHYAVRREANYKPLVQKIIVEPFAFGTRTVWDVKMMAYRGRVGIIMLYLDDRQGTRCCRMYDRDWRHMEFSFQWPMYPHELDRPANLAAMIAAADKLAAPFELVRIDMYTDGETFLIGELTHTHDSAEGRFTPPESEAYVNTTLFGADAQH